MDPDVAESVAPTSGEDGSDVDPMAYDVLIEERMRELLGTETGDEPVGA